MQVLNEGRSVIVPVWCKHGTPKLASLIESCISSDPRARPTFAQILFALDKL